MREGWNKTNPEEPQPCPDCGGDGIREYESTEYAGDSWEDPKPFIEKRRTYCWCEAGRERQEQDMKRSL